MTSAISDLESVKQRLQEIFRGEADFQQKAEAALDVSAAFLDVDEARVVRVGEARNEWYSYVSAGDDTANDRTGVQPLDTTFCRRVVADESAVTVAAAHQQGWGDDPAYRNHDVECYLGVPLYVGDNLFGTVCFFSADSREQFDPTETLFAEFLAAKLGSELQTDRLETELDRRSNLITVLSRVLRHNIRNGMTVIRGYLAEEVENPGDSPAFQRADQIIELSEKARRLEQIANTEHERKDVDVVTLVEREIETVAGDHPQAEFSFDAPAELSYSATGSLRLGIRELLENAAVHAGDAPSIDVAITQDETSIKIRIADDGPGLDNLERSVLVGGAETPLEHGTGLGLWLVYWVMMSHGGEIDVDATASGTVVHLSLPKQPPWTPTGTVTRQHYDRFRSVFEDAFDAMVLVDDEGRIVEANGSAGALLGLPPDDLLGRHFETFVASDDPSVASLLYDDSQEILAVTTAAGDTRRVEYATTTDIVPEQHLLVLRDVTERLERQAELERHRAAVEAANDVIVTIDEASTIQWVNSAVESVFGYARDALVGEPLTKLMPERLEAAHREGIDRYLETGERTLDWDYIELPGEDADGNERSLAVSFSELEHDGDRYFTGVIRDVTEPRARKRELEETKRKLELALDATDTGIWEWNPETGAAEWHESTEQLFDLDPGTFAGDISAFIDLVHEADRERLERAATAVAEDGGIFEVEFRAADELFADTRWFYSHAEDVDDEWYVGATTDITAVKERERRNYDRIADGFYSLNEAWEFTYANDAAGELFERSPEELIGDNIWELYPEARESAFYEHYHEAIETQEPRTIEGYYEPWDRWYEESLYPSADGLSVIARDITERKQRQDALERQRTMLEAVIEAVPYGVMVTDEDRDLAVYNQQFVEMWGLSSEVLEAGDETRAVEAVLDKIDDSEAFLDDVEYYHEHTTETGRKTIRMADGRQIGRYTAPVIREDGTYHGRVWLFRTKESGE